MRGDLVGAILTEAAPDRAGGCDPQYARGIRRQFGHPRGLVGWLVGHLMAVKNQGRSRWVLDLLDIRPEHRVLEVGFGSGVDIRRAAERARHGWVAGIDHSRTMVRQASRRNAGRIRPGQVELRQASAEALPYADGTFDRGSRSTRSSSGRTGPKGCASWPGSSAPAASSSSLSNPGPGALPRRRHGSRAGGSRTSFAMPPSSRSGLKHGSPNRRRQCPCSASADPRLVATGRLLASAVGCVAPSPASVGSG